MDDLRCASAPAPSSPTSARGSEKPNVSAILSDDDGDYQLRDHVKSLLSDVNDKLQISDTNMQDLATGRTNDLQKVVTSVEEANLALQYTMAVRTKLLTPTKRSRGCSSRAARSWTLRGVKVEGASCRGGLPSWVWGLPADMPRRARH